MLTTLIDQGAEILVETYEADRFGESVAVSAVEKTAVPCKVRPMSGEMLAKLGIDRSRRVSRIYFAERPFPESDARQRLIQVGSDIYRPIDAHNVNSLGRLWQVDCELVTS